MVQLDGGGVAHFPAANALRTQSGTKVIRDISRRPRNASVEAPAGAAYNPATMRYLLIAALVAAAAAQAPTATITKPRARTVSGGTCRVAANGTFGGNFGSNASLPTLALTIGPGAAMADQLHANKAKFTGPGKYANEIIAVYLGKTALEDSYLGLGTVVIAADGKSGTFSLNDNSASGTFDCGVAPARQ